MPSSSRKLIAPLFFILVFLVPALAVAQTAQVSVSPSTSLAKCDDSSLTLSVDINTNGLVIRGYEVKVAIDETKLALPDTASYGIRAGNFLPGATFVYRRLSEGNYSIACTILGSTAGVSGSGTLFSLVGDPVGEGTTTIALTGLKVRDPDNVDLSASATDGTVNIDCTAPEVTDVTSTDVCFNSAPTVTVSGTEGPTFGQVVELQYQYQSAGDPCVEGGWTTLASVALTGSPWGPSGPHTPGAAPASAGTYAIYVRAIDEAGNAGTCALADSVHFSYNPDAPTVQVTSLNAAPGNNKVTLSWTTPTLTGGEEVWIVRKSVTGYPFTTGIDAAYPTSTSDGTVVYQGTGTTYIDEPLGNGTFGQRDVFLYRAFVKSCGGELGGSGKTNLSEDFITEITTDATDAASNYWLGDLEDSQEPYGFGGPYDGNVNFEDLAQLSGQYGLSTPTPGNPEADFAPTVMPNYDPLGVPRPDGIVDFEDLIVLAINYDTVAPLHSNPVALGKEGSGPIRLALGQVPAAERDGKLVRVPLLLQGAVANVQGITTIVTFDPTRMTFERAEVSQAIANGSYQHFLKTIRRAGSVELGLALLGTGAAMSGEGEVVTLEFRMLTDTSSPLALTESKVRDTGNQELLASRHDHAFESHATPDAATELPAAYRLYEAQPNPFNPSTTLAFDLPVEGAVRLDIYDITGRLVRTLVNGNLPAGAHRVEWNGTDANGGTVASGVYFYELAAGDFRAKERMNLLK